MDDSVTKFNSNQYRKWTVGSKASYGSMQCSAIGIVVQDGISV